jgi:hypothetical protein
MADGRGSGLQAVDPDIDTLPLLAWSTEMASTVGSAAHRALLRMQHYFFFPILMFARFSWCEQSVSHNLAPKSKKVCCYPASVALPFSLQAFALTTSSCCITGNRT